ncbi:MAG: hypothetical protein E6G53_10295 [Actinobacteria bacterium]|nr:MAG: hypothetical protein E6G53_10295 [Actinomycetota bacterium]
MFDDLNADGTHGASEPGLAGWTVYVDYNGDGTLDPTEPSAVTDANGDYTIVHIAGNTNANPYVVREVAQPGWTCSAPAACSYANFVIAGGSSQTGIDFGAYQPGSVSGTSFEDLNGNGAQDAGDPGVAGSTVWVDYNANGALDPGEPSALTDSHGLYTIANVTPGSFTVREAARPGWTCSATAGDANGCYRPFTVAGGGTSYGNDFGSWRAASVSGTSFEDANRDGTWNVDEGPAPGVTVFVDLNGNGSLDAGEPSTVAGSDGRYTIDGLAPRTTPYSVVALPQSGWTCTTPAGCQHPVTLSSGDSADGRNFGSVPESSVSGVKFEDLNANGVRDAGEPALAGWTVYVDYDNDGARGPGEPFAVTDANGNYTIDHVALGSFRVREEPQAGWTCSAPAGCSTRIDFAAGGAATADFGAWQAGTVSGNVFEDSNRNGSHDGGETGLTGWTVFVDYNGNGEPDAGEPSAVTDSNGDYTIPGVTPGDWTVLEELQGQYVCTAPASCQQDLSVTSNGSTGGADFGDAVPGATIEGSVFNDLNADGAPRAFDPVSGDPLDPGLGGREVWLETVSDNGVIDPGEPTVVTSPLGDFAFRNVNPGTYKLRQVGEPGWTCSYPSGSDSHGCYRSITVGGGETASSQDFGDWASPSVSGRTYEDLNANGVHDGGEPYVNGWRVYLDTNDNGTFDAGVDPYAISDTASGNDGTYSISGIVPDGQVHQVREEPTGAVTGTWHCSEPAGGSGGTDCSRSFQNDSNASATGDFGNYRGASISGHSYEDLNANGIRDPGEPANDGRTVRLDPGTPSDSSDDLSTTVALDGSYSFTGLVPGKTYRVYEDLPAGWTRSAPAGGEYSVATQSGDDVTGRDFGSYRKASVSGTVFHDLNASAARDGGEPGIAGRTVYIDADASGDLSPGDPTTTTDSSGNWSFTGLEPAPRRPRAASPSASCPARTRPASPSAPIRT